MILKKYLDTSFEKNHCIRWNNIKATGICFKERKYNLQANILKNKCYNVFVFCFVFFPSFTIYDYGCDYVMWC